MTDSNTPPKKSKLKGCLLPGCLGVIVMLLVIAASGFFYVKGLINDQVENYTGTEAEPLEIITLDNSEKNELESKLAKFQAAIDSPDAEGATKELVLNEREFNGLIASELDEYKDSIKLGLNGDTINADLSLPLDQFANIPMLGSLEDRFFNGKVELDISLENGVPEIYLLGAEVGGAALPESVLDAISNENLADELMENPDVKEFLEKLDSLKIEDGKAIFKAR